MSVDKSGSRLLAFLVYGLLVCFGLAIAYFALHGAFSAPAGVALSLGYFLIVALMVRRAEFLPRLQLDQLRLSIEIKMPNLVKSVICFVAAIVWAGFAASVMSDTAVGNAVVAVPSLLLLGIGGFFVATSFINRIR